MPNFDADVFAEWLTEAFKRSRFKSFAALADEAKLSRSSVSSLANAKKQPLTNKPSQPRPETAINLAKSLNEDVNKVLHLAGHASNEPSLAAIDDEFAALFYDSAHWSEENRNEAFENAKMIFKRYQEKERAKVKTQK